VNRKTFSVAITLLLVVMVAASMVGSAQACRFNRRKKIPVTFTRGNPIFGEIETCTKGNRYFVKAENAFGTFIVEGEGIYLEKQPSETLGTTYYAINLDTGEGWAISFSNLNFDDGTFKGIVITRGVFGVLPSGQPFPLDVTQKGVWRGNGDYAGWTMVLEFTTGDDPVEGYVLAPQ
jgi:hypothetical protein